MLILEEIPSFYLLLWQRPMIFLWGKTTEQGPPFSDGLY